MSSLFSKPEAPQEDPAAAALRAQEQQRADQARTAATQDQLTQETLMRSRRFGTRSLFGPLGSAQSLLGAG